MNIKKSSCFIYIMYIKRIDTVKIKCRWIKWNTLPPTANTITITTSFPAVVIRQSASHTSEGNKCGSPQSSTHHTANMFFSIMFISLAVALAEQQQQQKLNGVVDFSDDTFAESVARKPHFVMFYAPWLVLYYIALYCIVLYCVPYLNEVLL